MISGTSCHELPTLLLLLLYLLLLLLLHLLLLSSISYSYFSSISCPHFSCISCSYFSSISCSYFSSISCPYFSSISISYFSSISCFYSVGQLAMGEHCPLPFPLWPFLGHPLPCPYLPPPFHCPFIDLSLPFLDLSLAFRCLSFTIPLPFPRPSTALLSTSHCPSINDINRINPPAIVSASYIIRFNVIDLSPQDGQSTPVFIIMLDLLQSNAGGGADQRTPPTRPVEILCDEPGSASKVCISRMHPSCACLCMLVHACASLCNLMHISYASFLCIRLMHYLLCILLMQPYASFLCTIMQPYAYLLCILLMQPCAHLLCILVQPCAYLVCILLVHPRWSASSTASSRSGC